VLDTADMEQQILSPILVSIRQAAELLGVCPRTVTNLLVAKKLKGRKLGRRTLIRYADLVQFSRHDHTTAPEQPQRHDDVTTDGGKSLGPRRSVASDDSR
jgi:excisionase family DNA binding protein